MLSWAICRKKNPVFWHWKNNISYFRIFGFNSLFTRRRFSCCHCSLPTAPCYFPYPVPFFQCFSRFLWNPRAVFSNKKEEFILPAGCILCTVFESLAILIFNRVVHPLQSLRVREILGHRGSLSDCMEKWASAWLLPCVVDISNIWGWKRVLLCTSEAAAEGRAIANPKCVIQGRLRDHLRRLALLVAWRKANDTQETHNQRFPERDSVHHFTFMTSPWSVLAACENPCSPWRGLMGLCWPRVTEWHPHGSSADRQAGAIWEASCRSRGQWRAWVVFSANSGKRQDPQTSVGAGQLWGATCPWRLQPAPLEALDSAGTRVRVRVLLTAAAAWDGLGAVMAPFSKNSARASVSH